MEYIRKSDALDLLDKALVRSVESGGGHEASGLVTAKCQIAAVPAVDVMPRAEHECTLKECENGYAATLHLERSRIANQREEINRLLKHARDVEKSRMYWKDKALRLGKQLHETLYGKAEETDKTCKDCIHYDLCNRAGTLFNHKAFGAEACHFFKNKDRLLDFPCAVGDMVYMPWEWNGAKGIACLEVTTMSNIIGFGWSFGTDFDTDDEEYADEYKCGRFEFDDIGKTVFLTREAAEAAVEERRSKHDNS